jgi:polysaccharide pyruvyl transferase WcaK-like protein
MFGLTCDYPALVKDIISCFADPADQYVLLVPHVVPPAFAVEDDLAAIRETVRSLPVELRDKVIVSEGGLDQNETKYLIGQCDFFLGARMHAAIAALSQGVPAVGMAYSKKFVGVFETAGVADCVLDMRLLNNEQLLSGMKEMFARRQEIRSVLENTMPKLRNTIFQLFDDLNWSSENRK